MYIIPISSVISNYFEINKKEKNVSFFELSKYKKAIEKCFRKKKIFVIVDYTNASIVNTIINYSNFFEMDENKIIFKQIRKNNLAKEVKNYFNARLPFQIKEEYLKVFTEVNNECVKGSKFIKNLCN